MINFDELRDLMPFGKYNFGNVQEYMYLEKRIITDELLYDLVNGEKSYHEIFESDDPLTFVAGKIIGKCHIKPEYLLNALQKLKNKTADDFMEWFSALYNSDEASYSLTPNDFKEKFIGDYFFADDNHFVISIMNYMDNVIEENNYPQSLDVVINFIIEILNNRKVDMNHKNYSDTTMMFVLENLSWSLDSSNTISDNLVSFFTKNIELLASKNVYDAYKTLGYLNYEGSVSYPRNTSLALSYFLKAFEMKHESDIARTIGYIYYYGYHNDHRVPDYDKAFQYFSSSHNDDGNMEATYKLADCYLHGYGTEKNEKAAISLVSSIFKPAMKEFKTGNFITKLADICLRLASYYHNGVFPKKDDDHAQHLASIARCAIKKRLEATSYIGDKSVALSIENLIKDINKDNVDREIENNGYVTSPDDELVKALGNHHTYSIYADIDGVHLEIPKNNVDYFYNIAYSDKLNFVEVTHKIHILFKGLYDIALVDSIEEDDEFYVDVIGNTLILSKPLEDVKFEMDIDKVIYYPTSLKTLEKKYTLVEVEFETNGKLYEYLCDSPDVKAGDSLYVNTSSRKRVIIHSVRQIFEDQLPLPLNRMGKAQK